MGEYTELHLPGLTIFRPMKPRIPGEALYLPYHDWFRIRMRHLIEYRYLLDIGFFAWIRELNAYDQERTGGQFGNYFHSNQLQYLYQNWFKEGYNPNDFLEDEIFSAF